MTENEDDANVADWRVGCVAGATIDAEGDDDATSVAEATAVAVAVATTAAVVAGSDVADVVGDSAAVPQFRSHFEMLNCPSFSIVPGVLLFRRITVGKNNVGLVSRSEAV